MVAAQYVSVHHDQPTISPARITGISVTISLHLLAFLLLLLPNSNSFERAPQIAETTTVTFIEPPRPLPPLPIPPPDPKPIVKPITPNPTPAPIVKNSAPDVSPVVFSDPGLLDTAAEPTVAAESLSTFDKPVMDSGSPGLTPILAPAPPYPREALRDGKEGTVLLKIVVNPDGSIQSVSIEKSSSSRDLDRRAKDHVQKTWKFQATGATQVGLLPVRFSLN